MDRPHAAHVRSERRQRFQTLADEIGRETRHPGDVPPRVGVRLHEARRDGIADEREDDRNRLRRRPRGERRRLAAREDRVDARLDQRVGGCGNACGIGVGEPDVEDDVAAFFETQVAQPALEAVDRRMIGRPRIVQHADQKRRPRALGARGERKRRGQGEERRADSDRSEASAPQCHGDYFFTIGQSPWSMGRNASSAGIVARSLYKSHGPFDSDGFFTSKRYIG